MGVAVGGGRPYLSPMKIIERVQPTGALRDARDFLGRLRQPHQLLFLALSIAFTGVTLWAFWHDSNIKQPYHRDIVYVQQWRLDRTDAEIIAQQKIDGPEQTRRLAAEKQRQDDNKATFRRWNDKLGKWL